MSDKKLYHCLRRRKLTRERAEAVAEKKPAKPGHRILAYTCRYCDGWHAREVREGAASTAKTEAER